MKWNLGRSPSFFGTISDGLDFAAGFLSPGEIASAQAALDLSVQLPTDKRLAAAAASVQQARAADSLNAKMARWGLGSLLDALDAEVTRMDTAYPDEAPHALLRGPRFPKDDRSSRLVGRVASISSSRIFDLHEIFGDSYWSTVPPASRLLGRRFTAKSGADKGHVYTISAHVIDSPAYIRLVGDPWANGTHANVRFSIDGDPIPDDDVSKDERARDWVISSAIQGKLTAGAGAVLTCASVFGASGYWLDVDGVIITGNLRGRDLLIGSTAHRIVGHNPAANQVTVASGAGIVGNEAFRIMARSPAETGKQDHGTLLNPAEGLRYSMLEPHTTIRLGPTMVSQADPSRVQAINDSMDVVARYTHARLAKWRGSYPVFKNAVRSQKLIVADAMREAQRVEDLRRMSKDLNLPLKLPAE